MCLIVIWASLGKPQRRVTAPDSHATLEFPFRGDSPRMKIAYLLVLLASFVFAQAPAAPAEPAPDAVIATIDGKNLTYGELHSYISTLPQAQARSAMQNLENTVKQYAMLVRLSHIGEDQKLDQKQPYIDILRAGR